MAAPYTPASGILVTYNFKQLYIEIMPETENFLLSYVTSECKQKAIAFHCPKGTYTMDLQFPDRLQNSLILIETLKNLLIPDSLRSCVLRATHSNPDTIHIKIFNKDYYVATEEGDIIRCPY